MNVYRLRATALCPVDGLRDHYDVEIRTPGRIDAEGLREFFDGLANSVIFQEDITVAVRNWLKHPDSVVTITGDHPSPIRIESTGGTS